MIRFTKQSLQSPPNVHWWAEHRDYFRVARDKEAVLTEHVYEMDKPSKWNTGPCKRPALGMIRKRTEGREVLSLTQSSEDQTDLFHTGRPQPKRTHARNADRVQNPGLPWS